MSKATEVSIPQIARHVDLEVYDDVVSFHAKTIYANMPGLDHRCYLSAASPEELQNIEKSEISFFPGTGRHILISSQKEEDDFDRLQRNQSASQFEQRAIDYHTIETLVERSFCAIVDENNRRGYPSGGALYPIQVIVCRLSDVAGWPSTSDVLHLLPTSRKFEEISDVGASELLSSLSGGQSDILGSPAFAIVYAIAFDLAVFKYRYRGYRLALMEVGSMYQQADLCGNILGLKNRMWAGFNDYKVAADLGFDPRHVAPLAVQFFGAKL